jgi:hypothetical protein
MVKVAIRKKGDPLPLVRTSERTELIRCHQKWWWSYVDALKPADRNIHFSFGDLTHQSLAAFYIPEKSRRGDKPKRGPHPVKTFNALYDALEEQGLAFSMKADADEDDEKWGDARALGVAMLENYIDQYGMDERYFIVAPEVPFQIVIDDPATGKPLCLYVGQLDGVARDLETGHLGFLEHKTAKTIVITHLTLDEQAGTYWALGPQWLRSKGWLKPDEHMDFILYNFLRKGFKDDRPTNEHGQALNLDGKVSKRQPAPLFKRQLVYRAGYESEMLIDRIIEHAKIMNELRSGKRPVIKSPLNGCVGMLGCQWREMCELHETGANWEAYRDLTTNHWDPYEAHKGERD